MRRDRTASEAQGWVRRRMQRMSRRERWTQRLRLKRQMNANLLLLGRHSLQLPKDVRMRQSIHQLYFSEYVGTVGSHCVHLKHHDLSWRLVSHLPPQHQLSHYQHQPQTAVCLFVCYQHYTGTSALCWTVAALWMLTIWQLWICPTDDIDLCCWSRHQQYWSYTVWDPCQSGSVDCFVKSSALTNDPAPTWHSTWTHQWSSGRVLRHLHSELSMKQHVGRVIIIIIIIINDNL